LISTTASHIPHKQELENGAVSVGMVGK
jgi:hypothetical protein